MLNPLIAFMHSEPGYLNSEEVLRSLKVRSDCEVIENVKAASFEPNYNDGRSIVAIFCIHFGHDVAPLLNFLDRNQANVLSGQLQVLVLNRIDILTIFDLLLDRNCSEVLPSTVGPQELIAKIVDILRLKAIDQPLQQPQQLSAEKTIRWLESVEHPNELWTYDDKFTFKKVKDTFLVEINGPSRGMGYWQDSGKSGVKGERLWKWIPNKGLGLQLLPGPEFWEFGGLEPQLKGNSNKWQFISQNPCLRLRLGDAVVLSRFKLLGAYTLETHKNSLIGLQKVSQIRDTEVAPQSVPVHETFSTLTSELYINDQKMNIIDWSETVLRVDASKGLLALHAMVEAQLRTNVFQEASTLSLKGMIDAIEISDLLSTSSKVDITLDESSQILMSQIDQRMKARQEEISLFLAAGKGF